MVDELEVEQPGVRYCWPMTLVMPTPRAERKTDGKGRRAAMMSGAGVADGPAWWLPAAALARGVRGRQAPKSNNTMTNTMMRSEPRQGQD